MRILVVSDTHGDVYALREALLRQPKAEVVIHLGDGADDAAQEFANYPEKMCMQVRGNCDWGSQLPGEQMHTLAGKRIFFTHGHLYEVKFGLLKLEYAAREKQANLVLFGHTHQPFTDYRDGLYFMNPGSLHGSAGCYGIADITDAGIVTSLLHL